MDDIWFQEELAPAEAITQTITKSMLQGEHGNDREEEKDVRKIARCILRVDKPRWGKVNPELFPLKSGVQSQLYLVRLGFQFDIPQENHDKGIRFERVRCSAYLWSTRDTQPQPTIYEVIPSSLYEGKTRQVSIEFSPSAKVVGLIDVSLGKVSTDFSIGTVEPIVVGWPGEVERAPYWDLRPQSKTLLGVRHFWFIMEKSLKCESVQLATKVEVQLQTHLGVIPIGPNTSEWASRCAILIE